MDEVSDRCANFLVLRWFSINSATQPARYGEAIEVPEYTAYGEGKALAAIAKSDIVE